MTLKNKKLVSEGGVRSETIGGKMTDEDTQLEKVYGVYSLQSVVLKLLPSLSHSKCGVVRVRPTI